MIWLNRGYRLKIYDAFRPQEAVTSFVNWAKDGDDTRMKESFFQRWIRYAMMAHGFNLLAAE